jgi:hypothetical protein
MSPKTTKFLRESLDSTEAALADRKNGEKGDEQRGEQHEAEDRPALDDLLQQGQTGDRRPGQVETDAVDVVAVRRGRAATSFADDRTCPLCFLCVV